MSDAQAVPGKRREWRAIHPKHVRQGRVVAPLTEGTHDRSNAPSADPHVITPFSLICSPLVEACQLRIQ
jgi:hypothetical protein